MKAMVLESLAPLERSPLQLRERAEPTPGFGQIVIRVHACGVCRSQLHMIEGEWAGRGVPAILPIVPGHEIVGSIVELGPGVQGLAPGRRVGVQPLWSCCGRCAYCLTARENLCANKEMAGETIDGGFAEYMLATAEHVYPVPENLGDAEAAPLFCPGLAAYGAVAKAGLSPGAEVAVFGVGGVGHLVVQLALLTGAEVTAIDRAGQHLELAEQLGAQHVIDASIENLEEVLAARGGADAAIVFAPSDAVVQQAVRVLKPGGIAVLGVSAQVGEWTFDEKRLVSTALGPRHQMHEVLHLAEAGKLRVHYEAFALEDAPTALARLKADNLRARAVLVM
ncbi:MAG: alcohol dehydrogenase catalytic domain-containing protein [Acidimicrobiales bacterium]|jgi:propanol-preferring alcohol dehydrogenase